MKIKVDYVTNSSSTSFIIISDDELGKEKFFQWFGIKQDSNFAYIFSKLFEAVRHDSKPIEDDIDKNESLEEYLSNYRLETEIERVKEALKNGKKVRVGKLRSDENDIETFFCLDSFCIDDELVYFNALSNGW